MGIGQRVRYISKNGELPGEFESINGKIIIVKLNRGGIPRRELILIILNKWLSYWFRFRKKKPTSKKKVRKIYKGPRGGRYYITKGYKVYI